MTDPEPTPVEQSYVLRTLALRLGPPSPLLWILAICGVVAACGGHDATQDQTPPDTVASDDASASQEDAVDSAAEAPCRPFAGPAVGLAPSEWKAFRRANPNHTQSIRLGPPRGDGSRVLIISEPPPKICLDSLRSLSPALARIQPLRWRMGYDGWVSDAVVTLPRLSEGALDELLVGLHRTLFGSSYKASVVPLDAPPGGEGDDRLDMTVTAAELRSWLLQGGESFSATGADAGVSVSSLLRSRRYGEFFSSSPGFVLWVVPSERDITPFLGAARRWTLDADLILGAIADESSVAIVGRERQVPPTVLPPLRVETIRTLASSGTDHLAQSYERTFLLAGRYEGVNDWAPIYLSSTLIDDEYGSLLNITDQLLKSRSEHGTLSYVNFRYPAPPRYPFDRPLHEVIHASEVTFNWNTRGAGYVTDENGTRVYALNRTGALPVSYFAGSEQRKTAETDQAEETAYEYFASLNDPNLARVVQYAALYQLFREFRVGSQVPLDSPPHPQTALREQAVAALYHLATVGDDVVGQFSDSMQPVVRKARAAVLGLVEAAGKAGIEALTTELLKDNRDPAVRRDDSTFYEHAFVDDTIRDGLSQEDLARAVAWNILPAIEPVLSYFVGSHTRADARRAFVDAAPLPTRAWIHTASIVISRGQGNWVGGHNLDAAVTRFRGSSEVGPGEVRVITEGDHQVLLVNDAEVDRVSSNVRRFASAMEEGQDDAHLAELMSRVEALPIRGRADVIPPTPRAVATAEIRSRSGAGIVGYERLPRPLTAGERSAADFLQARQRQYVSISRVDGGGFEIVSGDPSRVLFAPNTPSAIDAVLGETKLARNAQLQPQLQIAGFSELDARSFMRNVEWELRRSGRAERDDLVGVVRRGSESEMGWTREADFSKARVTNIQAVDVPVEGGVTRGYQLDVEIPSLVPTESRPWLIRILVYFREGFEPAMSLVQEHISLIMGKLGRVSPDAAAATIKSEFRKIYGDTGFIELDAGDVTIVRRAPMRGETATDEYT